MYLTIFLSRGHKGILLLCHRVLINGLLGLAYNVAVVCSPQLVTLWLRQVPVLVLDPAEGEG